ncbi:adenylyltransferase and sulfurtransferase MOCS3 [Xenopus laevis]|uniref:Adenylyltransferase and sulfurtransferase MOCS3 n=2 Tax=Xenopus laevis TaxID=8355 RepID=MOCS3_XENLA|nr:adenylyltransferase and sulfurtransferase MOCS3 [Xenopus laevis]Q58E95.1 RecName: Full=Adenylyltransferase and sulfurtransferase MOCS3; AltName: Full=Molybdenum cofactor synthesis protein 3; Includes: RecName: Full=Molybdopterin-synthase adenylyltransferase; AltName: Full=Adenylyltransferase MOCS3; AltName: Full=Sulfur carrier protein MOCS2A adenylyltransferase; Includes: RecName: Full=Molybdopterin-synthase sulfurtransferase; AltName: Full=Sulfur carrier protein MOCS2A sulfurtransferase; AltNa
MDETDSQITCADSSVDKLSHLKRNEVKSCPLPELHGADEMLPELNKSCLTNPDILRYSRQLVLPDLGVQGQLKLSKASVLVIGCGGLGCPVAQYLAASGIGRLGLLDYDVVEMSNLHRQVLHGENRLGMSKSVSVAKTLRKLNSAVVYLPYHISLNPENALQIIQQYDIIADCSDNVPTRYLVNDTCVLAGKPLVSASALRWEGQLTVYNYHQGPCYRCLFPKPPPSETVTNCADGGVLGIVPGIIGSLQALEVLKIASGMAPSYSGVLLMFDALEGRFRNIKIRGKKNDCAACSNPSETAILQDYEAFCGSSASDKCRMLRLLSRDERLSVEEYKRLLDDHVPHILMDVRPQPEVDICRLPHSIHIPLKGLEEKNEKWVSFLRTKIAELITAGNRTEKTVITICKLGNDSQIAVKILQDLFGKEDLFIAKDVQGGLMAWAENIDPMFPRY